MNREKTVAAESRILIVDDDAGLCELVAEYLTSRGFLVETESDGQRALERALPELQRIAVQGPRAA